MTEIAPEQQVAVVIEISEFGTHPKTAIESVLSNKHWIGELHIIKHNYNPRQGLYSDWDKDLEQLRESGLIPLFHSQLDCNRIKKHAVVFIEPDMQVCDGAMRLLHQDMLNATTETHFAVQSILCIETTEKEKRDPFVWFGAMSYGFLLVIMMLDFFRSLYALGRYQKTHDLRGQFVYTTFPQRVQLAPEPWIIPRFWNMYMNRARFGGSSLMMTPSGKDAGLQFVLRTIKRHNHLGFGVWIFGFLVYYWLFAWPWWNEFPIGSYLGRDPYAALNILFYLLHTLVVGLVAWKYVELPLGLLPLQIVLFPFYLTLSPLLFFYGRFHISRAAWKRWK